MSEGIDRAREEFFSEAQEIVEGFGRDLLALDEGQRSGKVDPDLVNDVFRAVHTLKGLAGLFGASRMATLSHELESLLDELRLGKVDLTASVLDLLFRGVAIYGVILQAEKDGTELAMGELDELLRQLRRGTGPVAASPNAGYELDPSLLAVLTEYEEHRLRTNLAQGMTLYRLRVQFQLQTIDQALDELKAAAKPYGEIITYLPTGAGADADSIELDILLTSGAPVEDLRRAFATTSTDLEEVARRAASPAAAGAPSLAPPPLPGAGAKLDVSLAPPPAGRPSGGASLGPRAAAQDPSIRSVTQTVRVDIRKLDRLMNIVGELAIVRTSLARLLDRLRAKRGDRELATELHRLQRTFDRHLGAMQQGILEVRMVPLGQVFDKLARVVRQISRDADKQVNLVITGGETEIDKLIVEELSDPLMHMMRNAIDHGIETLPEREAVGKPAVGTIALNAFQKGNHVLIEVEDDGRGIDATKLVAAAVRRGVLAEDDARNVSRREALNLVFVPGLTTKSDVSELSGRGVGMDVVKTNIGKLGGALDLASEPGIGTKVTVTLPITLAIISALIVRVSGRLFAIPLANVQEAVLLDAAAVRRIDGREVVTLRGSTLPLCRLAELFELGDPLATPAWPEMDPSPVGLGATSVGERTGARQYVVVAAVGSRRIGLVVDVLLGEQDIVIKALGPSLGEARGFVGATELGDQRIALVLDSPGLVEELSAGADRSRNDPKGLHG